MLKPVDVQWQPPLPATNQQALDKRSMGLLNKVRPDRWMMAGWVAGSLSQWLGQVTGYEGRGVLHTFPRVELPWPGPSPLLPFPTCSPRCAAGAGVPSRLLAAQPGGDQPRGAQQHPRGLERDVQHAAAHGWVHFSEEALKVLGQFAKVVLLSNQEPALPAELESRGAGRTALLATHPGL